ncbi:Holliday junction resolvase RecU [Geobacillus stearothermophilus]|uniref:Holliday junction resolvase RecU n=1 Tax=Geobacillus stearothermophilus TaxID=1422 RepID=UPI0005184C6D|nr:Holliday junction resolvase RecU [Geobacillus stearothermophilus]MED4333344.1 Holliday junction resolvase RecU [Geobacillus stearothermophilus]MED4995863.1 Holliday junction resolvase RecU [Geobacillus stearothermophilus]
MAISVANRGMAFEHLIEYTNRCYRIKGIAHIEKVPTPWKVIRRGNRIISAFPEKKGMVDFIGIAHGRMIAFDAKSTRERTRFPLDNIEDHQMAFLKSWRDQGAITFFLVEFVNQHEVYLLRFSDAEKWWGQSKQGGRKSIPYEWFAEHCDLVKSSRGITIDYLKCLEK